jgi:hypothetical protein
LFSSQIGYDAHYVMVVTEGDDPTVDSTLEASGGLRLRRHVVIRKANGLATPDHLETGWILHRFERSLPLHSFPRGKGRERKDDGAMSLFSRLLEAVDSWRRRRGGPKTTKRADVAIEQLDHRRLLSVNFTGNVPVDFPATTSPGVVILSNNVNFAPIGLTLQPFVFTSGFNIKDVRVTYTPADDTLNVGLNGPPAGPSTTNEVIAGDADDNGNSGTVNPNINDGMGGGVDPMFIDDADFGGTEHMGISLDFTGSGTPQVVAGFSEDKPPMTANDPQLPKPYQVALTSPLLPLVSFGRFAPINLELPQFEGNVYTANSPDHPNLEFSIKNFSQLYDQITGKSLTPSQLATSNSMISIGGFGGSGDDGPIGEASIGPEAFSINAATPPPPPPLSPPILINPHEHRIIDTNHRDLIRVTVFGTSGFPVSSINPATVELDGVAPIAHFTRKVRRDEFPFETFVFVADQLNLPTGLTTATLTGQTFSGATFATSKDVLNLPHSALAFGRLKKYMGNASYYGSLAKFESTNPSAATSVSGTPVTAVSRNAEARGAAAIKVNYTPTVGASARTAEQAEAVKVRPVVAIKRTEAIPERSSIPTRVRYSMEHHLSTAR